MNHEMHLDEKFYNRIKKNEKKIEYRVNDEKRRKIKIGDTITFYLRPEDKEFIKTKIIDIKYYDNLFDMYSESFDHYLYKYYDSVQEVVDDSGCYSEEEIKKYGCVAIYFEKID
jgi:ASC-1-like (ASCH) protein